VSHVINTVKLTINVQNVVTYSLIDLDDGSYQVFSGAALIHGQVMKKRLFFAV